MRRVDRDDLARGDRGRREDTHAGSGQPAPAHLALRREEVGRVLIDVILVETDEEADLRESGNFLGREVRKFATQFGLMFADLLAAETLHGFHALLEPHADHILRLQHDVRYTSPGATARHVRKPT